ncbi:ABC transporter ATP-binding protein [Roseateles saccharophilus]|uniref:Molybdate transport system ATP-binding protein n=1 Tax=Roseateles saccharophilus TaxID=304 RepID=A0A4R3VAQ0_ROSSA|nr:ATP-binding cassette domain-containing protein [Roseateles saccharophilus]MDG0833862.1 ATP-binding cassette domain-containing protein [Roseateles saccharophilus]TCV02316.1 molybdate transport system ATP-binding protein [Roseateles saccharophilus]
MIDVRLQLSVSDARRRFDLDIAFATDAPFIALYGPSGAGKSLTLQAMAGLLPVRAGHVRLDGRTLLDTAAGVCLPPEARGVGYLFQQYALFPHLSVRDNIAFGLTSWRRRLAPEDAARVDALIESFGLGAMARSRPATLSGGQQQRVALARALACRPQVLLLDEPFAALHTTLRRELRAELRDLQRRLGIPAVIVSHDPDDVMALADEVFMLDGGGLQQSLRAGDPDLRAALERRS